MSIPKEPRALMINIMYLVLTALLALNVSAEVLNAFKTVEKGIKNSKDAVNAKNDLIYETLVASVQADGREEKLVLIEKADKARKYRKEFTEYIKEWQGQIVEESGGIKQDKSGHDFFVGKKDVETTTRLLVNNGGGAEIEGKINEYRAKFLSLLDENVKADYEDKLTLQVEQPDDPTLDWPTSKFRKVPVQAVHTILTGFMADAYNCESTILDLLAKDLNKTDFKIDEFEAMAVSESKFLLSGKQFHADIFLGARSSTITPEVYLGKHTAAVKRIEAPDGGAVRFESLKALPESEMPLTNAEQIDVDDQGRAVYDVTASGSRTVQGVMKVEVPNTDPQQYDFYPFEFEYETFEAGSVVISPTAMNVLYIGVDNPVEIQAGNANPTTVSASGCGIRRADGPGKYVAKPAGAPRQESIVVNGRSNEGDAVTGRKEFRVKRIPDPYMFFGGKKAGGIPAAVARGQQGIIAKNDDFVFALRYNIVSFDMIYAPRSGPVVVEPSTSNRFTSGQQTILGRLRGGDRLFFSKVKVRLPDGTTREVGANFTII